jgi:hypothetical protein
VSRNNDFKQLCHFVVLIGGVNRLKRNRVIDYIYLAKTTSLDQLIPITYIVFLTKLQKRQTLSNGFALIEKRYHNQVKRCQNSRYIAEIKSWILFFKILSDS